MNPERYEDLLSRLLEGEITAPEAEDLARALAESPALRRNLQQHLVLWETWSHAQSPERSAEAFVRGLKTRLQAEGEGVDAFAAAVRTELESHGFRQGQELEESQAILLGPSRRLTDTIRTKLRSLWAMAYRPSGIVWATSLTLLAIIGVVWLASPRSAQAMTTIKGEVVCTACVLHEGHEHWPALRVVTADGTSIYYLEHNPVAAGIQAHGTPKPLVASGYVRTEGEHHLFRVVKIAADEQAQRREPR